MLSELIKYSRKFLLGKEETYKKLQFAEVNVLKKGIYSLDGFEICPAEEFGVIVHPFSIFSVKDIVNPKKYTKNYLKNFYGFLNEFEGPVLTLEEEYMLEGTINRYKERNRTFNRFFVKSRNADPDPIEIGWEDVNSFIKNFKPQKIKVAGGRYYDGLERIGCLDFTIITLRKDFKNIEIVDSCTF